MYQSPLEGTLDFGLIILPAQELMFIGGEGGIQKAGTLPAEIL
jgi:hypothetical protein